MSTMEGGGGGVLSVCLLVCLVFRMLSRVCVSLIVVYL